MNMPIMFKDLYESVRAVTSAEIKENEKSNTVVFIKKTVKKLNNILGAIDTMLKKRNVDLKKIAEDFKSKGNEYINKGKSLVSSVIDKGPTAIVTHALEKTKSKLGQIFKKSNETTAGPPKDSLDNNKRKGFFSKLTDEYKSRKNKRDTEITEEKDAVKKMSGPKKTGWLNKIIGAITSLGGFLLTGFKKITMFGGELLLTGLKKILVKLVPKLSQFISKKTSGLVGSTVKKTGKYVLKTGARLTKKLFTSAAIRGSAMALGAGAAELLSGPVGWAALAASAGYEGYNLYKYFKRNDIDDTIYGKLTRLRFMMYGYDDNKKEHYSKLSDLDMLMKDFISYKNNKVTINKISEDTINKILDLFEVSRDDKDKYTILNNWFIKRYIPVLNGHLQALYSVNNTVYLDSLEKLTSNEIFTVASRLVIPMFIYNTIKVPFFDSPDVTVTQYQIDEVKKSLIDVSKKDTIINKDRKTTTVTNNRVLVSKDNLAQNKLSRNINELEKSKNIYMRILRWVPFGNGLIHSGKVLNKIIQSPDVYAQLTKLRFMMYGFGEDDEEHFDKLSSLDLNMKKYTEYKNGVVTLKNIPEKDLTDLATLFNINPEQQYDVEIFNNWLNNRYVPSYVAYMQVLLTINNKLSVETITSLSYLDVVSFIKKLKVPVSVFKTNILPTEDYKTSIIDADYINEYKDKILIRAERLSLYTKIKNKFNEVYDYTGKKLLSYYDYGGKKLSSYSDKVGSYVNDKIINPFFTNVSNITKFSIMAFTSNFEGEKIIKLMNLPLIEKLTKLRFMMYGLDVTKKEYYIKVAGLEMLMSDYVEFKNNSANIRPLDIIAKTKVFDILEINKDDDNKYQILNNWFNNRFLPAYTSYIQALLSANSSLTLVTLDRISTKEVYAMLIKLAIPNIIHNVTTIPFFPDYTSAVTREEITTLKSSILAEVKVNLTKTSDKKPEQPKPDTAPVKRPEQPAKIAKPDNNIKNLDVGDADAEKDPGSGKTSLINKVSNKLNKASGEIYSGGLSLEGIKTKLDKEKIYNLDPNVRELFTGMAKEYNSITGESINVNEAFRTYEDQNALYKKDPSKAAHPGESTHEYGLAIDIESADAEKLEKLGLLRKYGFTRPIGKEKWHLEPIGVSLNPRLAKDDTNYRYGSILASPGKGGDGYGTLDSSIKKKRDTQYQADIYNKDGENIIDVSKAINASVKKFPKNIENKVTFPTVDNTFAQNINNKTSINKDKNLLYTSTSVVGNNSNTDIANYSNLDPAAAIKQTSKMTGVDENVMTAYAKMESSLGNNTVNKKTSAGGLFQITDATWRELVAKHGNKYGIPSDANKNNNLYNSLMAAEYAKDNLTRLKGWEKANIDKPTAMYLAHHYGVTGANNIIRSINENPDSLMANSISGSSYKNNAKEIAGDTVSGYVHKVSERIHAANNTSYPSNIIKVAAKNNAVNDISIPAKNIESQPYRQIESMFKQVSTDPKNQSDPQPQNNQIFDTENMESIMTNQLNTLLHIANILTSIDGKFNIDNLKGLAPSGQQPIPNKGIPSNSVNLSNKRHAIT